MSSKALGQKEKRETADRLFDAAEGVARDDKFNGAVLRLREVRVEPTATRTATRQERKATNMLSWRQS